MPTANLNAEIKLVSAMKKYDLSIREATKAMQMFADDKRFQEELDRVYNNEVVVDDWDDWYPLDEI
tara:strand:+ start:770 stop:967 length:198 start_codon:yes stop_codon:yes gene_type:complete